MDTKVQKKQGKKVVYLPLDKDKNEGDEETFGRKLKRLIMLLFVVLENVNNPVEMFWFCVSISERKLLKMFTFA